MPIFRSEPAPNEGITFGKPGTAKAAAAAERWRALMGDVTPQQAYSFLRAQIDPDLVPHLKVHFEATGEKAGELELSGSNRDGSGILAVRRMVNDSKVYNEYFNVLDYSLQGKGIGKQVTAALTALFRHCGKHHFDIAPGLSAGGYVWARFGFAPTDSSWPELREHVEARFNHVQEREDLPASVTRVVQGALFSNDPRQIWALAALDTPVKQRWRNPKVPLGKHLLLETEWEGYLDLKDTEMAQMFYAYVPDLRADLAQHLEATQAVAAETTTLPLPDQQQPAAPRKGPLRRAWRSLTQG